MTIGNRIRECRAEKRLTLQQVGDHFGINRASVSDWEHDKTRPDLDRLVQLARLLGTSLDYLLAGKPGAAGHWPFTIEREQYDALSQVDKDYLDRMVKSFVEAAVSKK